MGMTSLTVPDRVHIMPVAYEVDRVVQAAKNYKAEVVVLIQHSDDKKGDKGRECYESARNGLLELGCEVEEKKADIFSLYDSLSIIGESINQYINEDVFVNISTGSKITAVAGMIASMVMDTTAYYTKAKKYYDNNSYPEGIEDDIILPRYPIDSPDVDSAAVLEYIRRRTHSNAGAPTKGELIHFCERNGLGGLGQNVNGQGKYRILDKDVLKPLEKKGYVRIEQEGRNKIVSLTDAGESVNQAFRHLVNESDIIEWNPNIKN